MSQHLSLQESVKKKSENANNKTFSGRSKKIEAQKG